MMTWRTGKSTIQFSITAIAILLAVTTAGCLASVPSGTEFQKETTPSSKSKSSTTAQTVTPTPAGKIEGYEIYENKDPFQPLIGAGANTRTLTTTTTDSSGAVVSSTTTTVRLDSISGSTANITVNGTPYNNLKVGDSFGGSFKVISIGTGSVVIQFGDNQYTLYLGETINVK